MSSNEDKPRVQHAGVKNNGGHQRPEGGSHQFKGKRQMDFQQCKHLGDRGGPSGPRGGLQGDGPQGMRNPDDRLMEKVMLMSGPTYDLPPMDHSEKRFSGRSKLYFGNIANDVEENEIRDLFAKYGETSELFLNKEKNFGFVRMDFRSSAEKAKCELDGFPLKGRNLKIRFASGGSTVKVKNLTHLVTNELLYTAFSIFGEIERAIVIVDNYGKSTGEGIVHFARKGSAMYAIRKCSELCFFLTSSPRPVIVEPHEVLDDCNGLPERSIPRKNPEYLKQREIGPRFAKFGSFEHEYGMQWKQIYEMQAQKEAALKKEFELERQKLEAQMEYIKYEQETQVLREQLQATEMERERQKQKWEMKEHEAEEARHRFQEQMRSQQKEKESRMLQQEEEMRPRKNENELCVQAHCLNETLHPEGQNSYNSYMPAELSMTGMPPMNRCFEGRGIEPGGPCTGGKVGGRGHWFSKNRGGFRGRDGYPNKRRRY